jgi:putative ABC transport system permease protein
MTIDRRPPLPGTVQPLVSFVTIRARYFDALGLRLLRGRTFTDRDAMPGSEAAIVNQRIVSMFFSDRDPIGHRICLTATEPTAPTAPVCATIVGVSPTVRQQDLQEIDPVVYYPDRAVSPSLMFMVRVNSTEAVARLIRTEIAMLDSDIGLNAIVPLEHAMTQSRWGHRVFGGMLRVFALVGLLLAAVGLYAVTAFSVVQRTQEIGVRMALGAQSTAVVWLVVRHAAMPVGCGIAAGFVGALALGQLLKSILIGTGPADPATLAGIALLFFVVILAACLFPARRAARLDPLTALRYE